MTTAPFHLMQAGEHRYSVVPADPSVPEHEPYLGMFGLCDENSGGITAWCHTEDYAIELSATLNAAWMLSYHYENFQREAGWEEPK